MRRCGCCDDDQCKIFDDVDDDSLPSGGFCCYFIIRFACKRPELVDPPRSLACCLKPLPRKAFEAFTVVPVHLWRPFPLSLPFVSVRSSSSSSLVVMSMPSTRQPCSQFCLSCPSLALLSLNLCTLVAALFGLTHLSGGYDMGQRLVRWSDPSIGNKDLTIGQKVRRQTVAYVNTSSKEKNVPCLTPQFLNPLFR